MSGRSAYARKIKETKATEKGGVSTRGRAKSTGSSRSSERDDATISDYPMPHGTGYGTTNARFLKFSEPRRETDPMRLRGELTNFSNQSSGSQNSGGSAGRRDGMGYQDHMSGYAYAKPTKPTIRTEDVSGIERSGLRSAIDKRSDGVRKGLSKALGFAKKSKKGEELRPQSSATIRPGQEPMSSPTSNDVPPLPSQFDSGCMSPPPSSTLPPLPPAAASPVIKRWIGAGRPVQRWNKLRKDPELWDPNGDVLVFFGHRGQSPRANPSFRLSSHIIEATESRFLVTLLREGSTDEDIYMSASPDGAPPMLQKHGMNGDQMRSGFGIGRNGQPTPPMSEDTSLADADGQISYEMYFPTPPNMDRLGAYRHAITTRNVFALLYHASLVGLSLHQALSDLHDRLDTYMPPEADNVGTVLNYISARGIDDARNDPETAVSLLAWSEMPEVRWEEGWREAFLHSAGMYSRLEGCADFKYITPITRALLERACLECQLRVQAAEERLCDFGYADTWPSSGPITTGPARSAADRLQKFIKDHYISLYGRWPPPASGATTSDGEEMWLTRNVAQTLQRDFGALYDYLVNRDIVWDESETRSSRKWMMVSESGNRAFAPDTRDLPLTDMLIEWDNRLRFPHIPHPYPLVPESILPTTQNGNPSSGKSKKVDKDKEKNNRGGGDERILERRVQLAYTEATNIYILGSDLVSSPLVDGFVRFEKGDQVGAVDPSLARRGRWVLIYAILQTLASVAVDAPNVRYRDDVAYHLSPRLKGTKTPPWKGVASAAPEAAHELSHCWLAPRAWGVGAGTTGAESDASVTSGGGSENGPRSPVTRMMRAQARGQQSQAVMQGGSGGSNRRQQQQQQQQQHSFSPRSNQYPDFPSPPLGTPATTASRGSGWPTGPSSTATRSNWSSNASVDGPPTTWGGSSAMSAVSDDDYYHYSRDRAGSQSGARTPSSAYGGGGGGGGSGYYSPRTVGPTIPLPQPPQSRDGSKSVRSYATFGVPPSVGRVDESEDSTASSSGEATTGAAAAGGWPARGQSIRSGGGSGFGNRDAGKPIPPLPLPLSPSVTGRGGFLNLEDSPPQRLPSRSPRRGRDHPPPLELRGSSRAGSRRGGGGGGGGNAEGLSPVIRDLEFMDVIDDHEP
ncbi:hypothetical protein PG993_015050 [Apiospora rasikravindrae]|uniref:DUF8004 domain-containing protein n=1 Tax=Apiospora rasikravindrae TaxID=990691 RepID=A0ABR1RPG3_9PEZI